MDINIDFTSLFLNFFQGFPMPMFMTEKDLIKYVNNSFTQRFDFNPIGLNLDELFSKRFLIQWSPPEKTAELKFRVKFKNATEYLAVVSPFFTVAKVRYGYIGTIYSPEKELKDNIYSLAGEIKNSMDSLKNLRETKDAKHR